jgi:GTP-binding protein HflX
MTADKQEEQILHFQQRESLRRVESLSTELSDISEVEYRKIRLERVVLIGVWASGSASDAEYSLSELAALAQTAGSVVLEGLIQRRAKPDASTYVGRGKAAELAEIVASVAADTVVCDGELTPGQLRKLEEIVKVKVVDRTWLILDIFAQHAQSREGKAQVELAQLEYMLPRLRGWGEALSRQAGGIGTRGPGETKIETDRRRIRAQISRLRGQLTAMKRSREVQRSSRDRIPVPAVAIVGYTNAGKSTLLNALSGANVLIRDELFATLDPTVRRTKTSTGREYTLADTVGFVRHLPHQLVEAFRSTLEEVRSAGLLVHVVDGSDADPISQIEAVRVVLRQIDAQDIPELIVINKADLATGHQVAAIRASEPKAVLISAATGEGIDDLKGAIESQLPRPSERVCVVVPFSRGDLISQLHTHAEVQSTAYLARGTRVEALVPEWLAPRLAEFAESEMQT